MANSAADDTPAELNPAGPRSGIWQFLFGLRAPVNQKHYAIAGFSLMLLKYLCEAIVVWQYTDLWMTPIDFANPFLSMRNEFFKPPAPSWLIWAIIFWSGPFLWVMVSMSVRRANHAGYSGSQGLFVLVPLVGMIAMLLFCILPPSRTRPPHTIPDEIPPPQIEDRLRSALLGVVASVLLGVGITSLAVYGFGKYGEILFAVTPVALGALSSYIYNQPGRRTLSSSIGVANLSILLLGLVILLFALEGVICLLMLLPLATLGGTIGGMIGYTLANVSQTSGRTMTILVATLPLLMAAESRFRPTPVFEVVSSIEIDASPDEVWKHVVQFPPLPEQRAWYFRLGIACPLSATIDGSGIGAVRHCIFTTGTFVEPITVWQPGQRLAFDVSEQPAPMRELSPYGHIHAPHLDGYLKSLRGEFRLVALPNGRTRLEGSTWYTNDMYPTDYWSVWTDTFIHLIHMRVLDHIKQLAESPAPSLATTIQR